MSTFIQILGLALLLGVSGPAFAEVKKPFGNGKPAFGGDFTFKKIAPPKAGSKDRINIQIEPRKVFPPDAVADLPPKDAPKGGSVETDWFWQAISPEIQPSSRGRFSAAVEHLKTSPGGRGVYTPRLETLRKIAAAHGRDILVETVGKGVSPALVLALISVESGGRPTVESNKGAQGLMQLIPATAERFGVSNANDPAQNIKGGVAYLSWLLKHFDGDPILALAGYNAGEGAVRKYGGVPPYSETRAYVPKVLAAWRVAKGLCLTPPELHSDGCVFKTSG